jgi:hypothetical protein
MATQYPAVTLEAGRLQMRRKQKLTLEEAFVEADDGSWSSWHELAMTEDQYRRLFAAPQFVVLEGSCGPVKCSARATSLRTGRPYDRAKPLVDQVPFNLFLDLPN